MTIEQVKDPTSRPPRSTPRTSRMIRRTARTAWGAYISARISLRALSRLRSAPSEIAFPEVQFRPGAQFVELIYQASVGAGARVVAVIGVEAGDGASSCARALAGRSALAPSRTLLVDASDSPRPVEPALASERDNLEWFRLGDGEDEPFGLRSPDMLRRLWTEAHRDWETVIIDCGPAIEGRDYAVPGKLTARSADAVILVCLGGKSTKGSIEAAKAAIGQANIVGVVVNGRDQPTVGAELAREAMRVKRLFPKFARRLAERALQSKTLNVPA